ncbi:G-D-S-L family lipolytic protein [Hymenobacter perfusus]|uniref:G-D-S-L family lipolytic protein n=1 Tax=Hymenobacter perfusus TaxID=1236770 RepID=A0A3R9NST5_9BACT|nr:G-D-S-L family lipolytic protein [Hymenobacter perfusus]RSK42788.1 G-D-S-L family lipolytic protein [Hymenobacter perfusus]
MNTYLFRKVTPLVALLGLGLTACQPDIEDDFRADKGSADFSRYIAVGNSLTAGFSDGGLYLEGQQNSYPSILAQQFSLAGGGEFNQPLFTEAQSNGSGYLRLTGFTAAGTPITANVTTNLAVRSATPLLYTRYDGRVDNLGVPGIRLSDIQTPGYGSTQGNPYFERITPTSTPTQSYFQRVKAEAATATFFSNWLGNNDVLGYATAGGAANTITNVDTFRLKNNRIINVLTASGSKGVVATIPDVTNVPFFTTVGPTFRATLAAASVPGIVVQTGSAFGGPTSTNRKQVATTDIRDASGSGRQLFTLLSSPFLGLLNQRTGRAWRYVYAQSGQPAAGFSLFLTAYGIDTTATFGTSAGNPIPSLFVLDDVEQGLVRTATTSFNSSIVAKANEKGLAIFDANAFFSRVATSGIVTNGVNNTAAFIAGNLFSLDGVHPTPRGYAVVANEMIRAINAKYGAKVPTVNANDYRGVRFPQ